MHTNTVGVQTTPKKRRKYLGPEADFWDSLKGREVRIEFRDQARDGIVVRLDWVDRYTVGIRDLISGKRRLLFKTGILFIERDSGDGPSDTTA